MTLQTMRWLLLAGLAACAPAARGPSAPAPRPAATALPDDGAAHVTLLHINDVYEVTAVDGGKAGGLARVATLLKRLEAANPATRMLLGGDFLSPSAIGTARVNGERLAGRQMIAVLNAVGLDLATLGNHEFDLSFPELGRRIAESTFGYVLSNVTDSLGRPHFGIPRHRILRLTDGRGRSVRLGVVGAVLEQVRRPNLRYLPPLAALRAEIAAIKDSVDAIVALTHLMLRQDIELAEELPELDLIVGGHEHENWALRRGARLTPIVKADANVRTVAIIDVAVRPGARPKVEYRLMAVTDSIPEDPAVAAEAKRWTDLAYEAFRQDGLEPARVIATLPMALDARETIIRNQENELTRLLTGAWMAEARDAEVALINSGSVRLDDVIPAGPITEYDVIRLLPFGGKAVMVEMSGALLRRVLEQGDINRGIGGFLLKASADMGPMGWRVGSTPLDTLRSYRVVTTDFLVSGGEQNLGYLNDRNPGLRLIRTLRDVRLIAIDELKRRFGR
ncbi:MAG: bifunctional metallophosphatase/5'-nucleotidase [Gemmatimonadales bacterium]|nr:bifunctional metallophosphatase/5'-nucleotidase [Gemmatimonadales bacterium]